MVEPIRPINVALNPGGQAVKVVEYFVDRVIITSDQAVEFGKLNIIEPSDGDAPLTLTLPTGAVGGESLVIKANNQTTSSRVYNLNLSGGQRIWFRNDINASSSISPVDGSAVLGLMCIDAVNQWWSLIDGCCGYYQVDGANIYVNGTDVVSFTDGQLLIGQTGGAPVSANLTAGSGISITNGAGSITIDATGLESVVITSGATTAGQVNKKYIIDSVPGHIVTLPAVSNPGDIMAVEARNCHVFIEQNAGNQIHFQGGQVTTLGITGFIKAEDTNSCINLTCITANASWGVESQVGCYRINGVNPPAVLVSPTGVSPNDDLEVLAGQLGSVPKNKTLTSLDGSIIFSTTPSSIDMSSTAGLGITLTSTGTDGDSLVSDGASPTLSIKKINPRKGLTGVDVSGSYTIDAAVASIVAGTAISTSVDVNNNVTITNTAPDQTVVLTSGTGITTTGTYPNFTITNSSPDQTVSITNSNGLTISGTYPDFTIGITAPISIANGGTNATAAIGAAGTIAQSDGTKYTFTTATYPATAGTSGTVLRSNGTNIVNSTATFSDTYAASALLYSNNANTVTGLATANSSTLVTNASGVPAWAASMTNGQVLIGSTSATPTPSTINAGTGVSIANGAGSITISANGNGAWIEVTGASQSAAVNTSYIANNASLVTITLPTTAAVGDYIRILGKGAGLYKINQNAGQTIRTGTTDTTTGATGSLTATNRYDCILLRCITANTDFIIEHIKGAFTIA